MTEYQKNSMTSRDTSWLSFNGRILDEASKTMIPVGERLKFLAIYSSNLDEFYCVRIPVLLALKKLRNKKADQQKIDETSDIKQVKETISAQQDYFGTILSDSVIPTLAEQHIHLVYNEAIPACIREYTDLYFFNTIAAFLEVNYLEKDTFVPKNNQLYLVADFAAKGKGLVCINIPATQISRFFTVQFGEIQYIVFIDDIIRANLKHIFIEQPTSVGSFKISRDAELDLQDEFDRDVANQIEKLLSARDYGMASRLLYQPDIPPQVLRRLIRSLQLEHANHMSGGVYHNLKDFFSLPLSRPDLHYPKLGSKVIAMGEQTLFEKIRHQDFWIHTPYHAYHPVLRFFAEAVLHPDADEIFVTLYRVASDSQIVHALMSAAKNGKKVTVFVELKARFDEANNIKWAKNMKNAGIRIIDSSPKLKVHAKIALIKFKDKKKPYSLALLSTGNFNEQTASVYTDHCLFTGSVAITEELGQLFDYLGSDNFGRKYPALVFEHLLVAKFNLLPRFLELVDNEIENVRQGKTGGITIKLNNLEEEVLIHKLYEASQAGVRVDLIVRGICRLRAGVPGLSDTISVTRIVDRFLEHGRVLIFNNNGEEQIYLGSADWMERNIYRRIEVCFPIYDEQLRAELRQIIKFQLTDDTAAVQLDEDAQNRAYPLGGTIRSQEKIREMINL